MQKSVSVQPRTSPPEFFQKSRATVRAKTKENEKKLTIAMFGVLIHRSSFPVKPGALMPKFDGYNTEDRAVLFVLGVEA